MRACVLLGLAGLVATASITRADFGATLTTIGRTYGSLQKLQGVERARWWGPIDQNARITWDGGARDAWTIDASLRYRLDVHSGKATDDNDFDVMIARAGWRSSKGLVGLQFGRIQSTTGFGWKAYDGARLDFPKLPALRVFCFAGAPVDIAVNGAPGHGFTWGAGVTGIIPKHGSVGIDYEMRKDDGVTVEATAGLDAGLRFASTEVALNADYSMVLEELGETSLLVGQDIAGRHHVEGRFTRVSPIWTIEDIWAVFDFQPYDETRLAYDYRGGERLSLGGYVARESYEKTAVEGPQDISRAAVTGGWHGGRESVHRGEVGWMDGWSGSRVVVRYDADWSPCSLLRVGVGGSFQDFQNLARLTERDQTWALRGRVRHDHGGKWDLALELEQYLGRDRDTLRGTLVFGTRFGSHRNVRPWWGGRWNAASWPGAASPRQSAMAAAPAVETTQ